MSPPMTRRRAAARIGIVAATVAVLAGCGASANGARAARRARPRAAVERGTRATGHIYFVASNGNNAGSGSIRRPWRTISHGLAEVRAGDRLYVRGGLYVERVLARPAPGRAGAPILVAGYNHEHPLIVGQLWIGEARYFTFAGINVTWGRANPDAPMVRFYGGNHWVLRDTEIFGAHSTSALHIDDGPNDDLGRWQVYDNCIHDTFPTNGENQDHNIYVDDMSHSSHPNGLIARNIIFDAPNGRGIKLGPGGTAGGPRNVTVRNNTIYNQVENISVSQAASNIKIERNILLHAADQNIGGFRLRGVRDDAVDNVAGQSPHLLVNTQSRHVIGDKDNHYPETVSFDSISCSGFHPTTWESYGKYG